MEVPVPVEPKTLVEIAPLEVVAPLIEPEQLVLVAPLEVVALFEGLALLEVAAPLVKGIVEREE